MYGNGIISEVDALMYVEISKAKKKKKRHVPYGELVGTTAGITS